MHTEDEAKTLWCPMARVAFGPWGGPANKIAQVVKEWTEPRDREFQQKQEESCRCIASACMAWRWAERQPLGVGFDGNGRPHSEHARGFCGAFGKPEA